MRSLIIVAALSTPSISDPHKDKAHGVSIDIPHAWSRKISGDSLFASDPTNKAAVMFTSSDGKTANEVVTDVGRTLAKQVTDIRWGAQRETVIKGKKVTTVNGTGKTGEVAIKTRVVIAMVKGQGVFLLGVVAADDEAAHRTELDHVFGSFAVE